MSFICKLMFLSSMPWMTLTCCKFELSRNFADFAIQQRLNERIGPYCQRRNCTFQWCIEYVDIAGRSSATVRQTEVVGKTCYFRAKCYLKN